MKDMTMAADTLTMSTEPIITIDDLTFGETTLNHIDYKFSEDKYLKELKEYIDSTY